MIDRTLRLLKALSDATRLRLLGLLAVEELNVAELCEALNAPQPTISRHLAVLREAGLVRDRREGPSVFYALSPQTLEAPVREAWEAVQRSLAGPEFDRDRERLARVLRQRVEAGRRFFEREAAGQNATRQSRFGDAVPWRSVAGLLDRRSVIVDLGAGSGDLLPCLAPRAGRVVAVDFSLSMLRLARARARAARLENVDFVQGTLEAVPLPAASADGVVLSLVLHHAARPAEAVREMARLLKPGGRAVVVDFLPHKEEWLRAEEGDVWLGFDSKTVRGWLTRAGLEVKSIEEGPSPASSGRRDRPGHRPASEERPSPVGRGVRAGAPAAAPSQLSRGVRHVRRKVQRR